MFIPTPHDMFRSMFGHLPKEEYEIIEELWYYRDKLDNTTGWFSRWKIKSTIKELEKIAFGIGFKEAMNDLEACGIIKSIK